MGWAVHGGSSKENDELLPIITSFAFKVLMMRISKEKCQRVGVDSTRGLPVQPDCFSKLCSIAISE